MIAGKEATANFLNDFKTISKRMLQAIPVIKKSIGDKINYKPLNRTLN